MTDINNVILPIIDRLIQPLSDRLDQLDHKLDKVIEVKERIGSVESVTQSNANSIDKLNDAVAGQSLQLAKQEGRNSVIIWGLGILSTIIAGIAVAGAGALFGFMP